MATSLGRLRTAIVAAAPQMARDLPWIAHPSPWAIVVAEYMLQQTGVERVLLPWQEFLEKFPTPADLAQSPLAEVLRMWSGLGYPRRARHLHLAARAIVHQHGGEVPSSVAALRQLPGVGPYTAHAIATFAFNAPVAVVDTNVGRVLARAAANRTLTPKEAQSLADELLDRRAPASFNQALLDLGAQWCRKVPLCGACPVRRSCAWRHDGGDDPAPRSAAVSKTQKPFAGSDRQWRGRVLAALRDGPLSTRAMTAVLTDLEPSTRGEILAGLERDALIERRRRGWSLSQDDR